MKVTRRYNQHRRDLWIDTQCEGCGHKATIKSAYDDHDYWTKWQPQQKCKKCGKSSDDLGIKPESIGTKYPAGMQI
jgi:hypothetical protein